MDFKQEIQRIRAQIEANREQDKQMEKLHGWIVVFTAITLVFSFLTVLVWLFK